MERFQEFQRQLTCKGAVAILVEIRQLLGVRPRARLAFRVVKEKRVELILSMTLVETFASVRPKVRPLDFKPFRDNAIAEKARKTLGKIKDRTPQFVDTNIFLHHLPGSRQAHACFE